MGMRGTAPPVQPGSDTMRGAILLATGAGLAIVLALPPPPGLSAAGRAALAVVLVAVVLWSTEALPTGATAVGAIILLALTGAVPDFQMALGGFARPTVFFLLGVLALGVATLRSGLAARAAATLLATARGRSGQLYGQMVASFALAASLIAACLAFRAILPNISAYLTLLIPVVMELAPDLGLNPLVCGMLVTIAGDSVLFFPAQSSSSLIVTERGHLGPGPVAQLAAVMVALIPIVLLFVALPYWAWLGQPLAR